MRVGAGRGDHLQPLDIADSVQGIENRAAGAGDIAESLQSRLARIPTGGDQNGDLPVLPVLPGAELRQMGKKLERHILEGQRRAMEELQHPGLIIQPLQGRDGRIVKPVRTIGGIHRILNFREGKILQKQLQDLQRAPLIGHLPERGDLLRGDLGKHDGHKKPAVRREAPENRLARGDAAAAAGGKEGHKRSPSVHGKRRRLPAAAPAVLRMKRNSSGRETSHQIRYCFRKAGSSSGSALTLRTKSTFCLAPRAESRFTTGSELARSVWQSFRNASTKIVPTS